MQSYIIISSVVYDDCKERFKRVRAERHLCDDGKFVADAQRELLRHATGFLSDKPDDVRVVVRPGGDQIDLVVHFCGCSSPTYMTAVLLEEANHV